MCIRDRAYVGGGAWERGEEESRREEAEGRQGGEEGGGAQGARPPVVPRLRSCWPSPHGAVLTRIASGSGGGVWGGGFRR
eukprot:2447420-Rhodomonas_salina.1